MDNAQDVASFREQLENTRRPRANTSTRASGISSRRSDTLLAKLLSLSWQRAAQLIDLAPYFCIKLLAECGAVNYLEGLRRLETTRRANMSAGGAFGAGITAATFISSAVISGARNMSTAADRRASQQYVARTVEAWAAECDRLRTRAERAERLAAALARKVARLEDALAEAEDELEALGGR